jgi:hypothetical protein
MACFVNNVITLDSNYGDDTIYGAVAFMDQTRIAGSHPHILPDLRGLG